MRLSGLKPVHIGQGHPLDYIGERTNVTDAKALARMILAGHFDEALAMAHLPPKVRAADESFEPMHTLFRNMGCDAALKALANAVQSRAGPPSTDD